MSGQYTHVKTETQVSAGGVALRRTARGLEAALISVGTPPRWQLPKGLIDKGETPDVAAVREVREEAGIDATPAELIEKVEYWYQANKGTQRIRYHKFVHFYLLWYESGNVSDHDDEVNEARWFSIVKALETLTFNGERSVLEKAVALAADSGERGPS